MMKDRCSAFNNNIRNADRGATREAHALRRDGGLYDPLQLEVMNHFVPGQSSSHRKSRGTPRRQRRS